MVLFASGVALAPGDRTVPWLSRCRSGWKFKPVKYVCAVNSCSLPETTDGEFRFRYIDISAVDSEGRWTATEPVSFKDAPSRARRVVRNGDVLISTVRTYLRAITYLPLVEDATVCSTGFAVVTHGPSVNPAFLAYWVRSAYFIDEIVARSVGVSYPAINASDIGNLPLPMIPFEEQRAIAAFLDRETERIDTLIAKKQRQIELLQEKRAALISHTVTKGLDPNVRMKDSGVEWLGEIPEHWEIKRIKQIGHIKYGLGEQPRQLDNGLPMIRATDIAVGKINVNTIQRVDPDDVPWSRDPALRTNDILLVRSGAYTGDSAIVPPGLAGAIAGYDMVLRVNRAEPGYVAYALLSKYLLQGQIHLDKLRAAQPHLNAEEFGSCIILLPPTPEQEEIVWHLDKKTALMDKISEEIEKSVNALREYRSALISAAVTGKIDVRNEASI